MAGATQPQAPAAHTPCQVTKLYFRTLNPFKKRISTLTSDSLFPLVPPGLVDSMRITCRGQPPLHSPSPSPPPPPPSPPPSSPSSLPQRSICGRQRHRQQNHRQHRRCQYASANIKTRFVLHLFRYEEGWPQLVRPLFASRHREREDGGVFTGLYKADMAAVILAMIK